MGGGGVHGRIVSCGAGPEGVAREGGDFWGRGGGISACAGPGGGVINRAAGGHNVSCRQHGSDKHSRSIEVHPSIKMGHVHLWGVRYAE
jgi:hypothetical protein